MEMNQTLNTLLVTLFQEIMGIEQKALITGESLGQGASQICM